MTPNAVDAYIHYLREKLGGPGRLHRDRARRRLPAGRCLTAPAPPDERSEVERAADEADAVAGPARPTEPRPVERADDARHPRRARRRALPRRRAARSRAPGRASSTRGWSRSRRSPPASVRTGPRRRRPVRLHLRPGVRDVRADPRRGGQPDPAAQLPGPARAPRHRGGRRGARPPVATCARPRSRTRPIRILTEPIQDGDRRPPSSSRSSRTGPPSSRPSRSCWSCC